MDDARDTPGLPDPLVADLGTAGQASQAAGDPVVIGAAPVPVEPGGPGVGAARTAHEAESFVTRPLTPRAEIDLGLRGGPLSTDERAELEHFRAGRVGAGVVVDAAEIPGRRWARAATAIKRDGKLYGPATDEPWVPLDFAGYTELVSIGAITDRPWSELEPVGEI